MISGIHKEWFVYFSKRGDLACRWVVGQRMALVVVAVVGWIDIEIVVATCGGGGGGGRGGMRSMDGSSQPHWTRADEAAEKALRSRSGIVYCMPGDGDSLEIWTDKFRSLSRVVPFVELQGAVADSLTASIGLDGRPALVLADSFGNPIWGFARQLSSDQILAGVKALGQATQALADKLQQELVGIEGAALQPERRAEVIGRLHKMLRYRGHHAVVRGQKIYDDLLSQARAELKFAKALIGTDGIAGREALRSVIARYPETSVAGLAAEQLVLIDGR